MGDQTGQTKLTYDSGRRGRLTCRFDLKTSCVEKRNEIKTKRDAKGKTKKETKRDTKSETKRETKGTTKRDTKRETKRDTTIK